MASVALLFSCKSLIFMSFQVNRQQDQQIVYEFAKCCKPTKYYLYAIECKDDSLKNQVKTISKNERSEKLTNNRVIIYVIYM